MVLRQNRYYLESTKESAMERLLQDDVIRMARIKKEVRVCVRSQCEPLSLFLALEMSWSLAAPLCSPFNPPLHFT